MDKSVKVLSDTTVFNKCVRYEAEVDFRDIRPKSSRLIISGGEDR